MHNSRQFMYTATSLLGGGHHPDRVADRRREPEWSISAGRTRSDAHGLERMGFNCLESNTAVVPIVIGPVEQMLWFNKRIYEEVFANPVLPPAKPTNACLVRTSTWRTTSARTRKPGHLRERRKRTGVIGPNKGDGRALAQVAETKSIWPEGPGASAEEPRDLSGLSGLLLSVWQVGIRQQSRHGCPLRTPSPRPALSSSGISPISSMSMKMRSMQRDTHSGDVALAGEHAHRARRSPPEMEPL